VEKTKGVKKEIKQTIGNKINSYFSDRNIKRIKCLEIHFDPIKIEHGEGNYKYLFPKQNVCLISWKLPDGNIKLTHVNSYEYVAKTNFESIKPHPAAKRLQTFYKNDAVIYEGVLYRIAKLNPSSRCFYLAEYDAAFVNTKSKDNCEKDEYDINKLKRDGYPMLEKNAVKKVKVTLDGKILSSNYFINNSVNPACQLLSLLI